MSLVTRSIARTFKGPAWCERCSEDLMTLQFIGSTSTPLHRRRNGAFASFVNKESGRVARKEGYRGPELKDRANELMKESMKIGTTDPIASQIRAAGQQHAMRVTNTNDTFASRIGVGLKNTMNKIGIPHQGSLKLGDLFIAFAKIPANVVANGIDYAGGSFVNAGAEVVKQISDVRDGEKFNYVPATRALIRGVGGVGASALIASFIQKDDYDEKTGMIRVRFGSHASPWISTELLSPLGPGVRGMLEAKFAKPGESTMYKYLAGVGEGRAEHARHSRDQGVLGLRSW
jgi:hypothetical protein